MENIDDGIKHLEELKNAWNEKYDEILQHAKSFQGGNDADYIDEFQKKLNSLSDELQDIGKQYHQDLDNLVDEVTKDYAADPIIQKMAEGVRSDIDDQWQKYHGNREARLRDLADLVSMLDKLP